MSAVITLYSQNVSCDIHSQKLMDMEGIGEEYTFSSRIAAIMNKLSNQSEKLDVIAFNEVRHAENVRNIITKFEENGYTAKAFANNNSDMSFNNIMAVSKSSQWSIVTWQHLWITLNNLQDTHCLMDGDPHGRCAGVVYLKHKQSGAQVCVVISHVMPVGDVKKNQQDGLFSINEKNSRMNPPIPTVILGDLNRFEDEFDEFEKRLQKNNFVEACPTRLVLSSQTADEVIMEEKNIGTFSPWPSDKKVYDKLLRHPLSESRLDVQLCSHERIKVNSIAAKAIMLFEPNSDSPPDGIDSLRHRLDRRMASDHIALVGIYEVTTG